MIVLDQVHKSYGSFTAVHEASFSIKRGEFFSLLGPSGCGKTTTLRMIAGFEQPTTGQVFLDGNDVSRVPPYKRNVNTVFQQYALFPHMTVFDNVAFGPRSKGKPDAEVRKAVADMLQVVRLADFAHRKPSQLSGGQQQRVALARALVNLPSALLLDEPLAALDLKLRQAMQIELKRIQREVGITFVFVTHDQEEALTMSDRIAVMNVGHVEQIGTPGEIYNSPSSVFVAGFIGTANLLPATIEEVSGDRVSARVAAGALVHAPAGDNSFRAGETATVVLRPERLQLHRSQPPDGYGFEATISDLIFRGSSSKVILQTPNQTELVGDLDPDHDLVGCRPGDRIWVSWQPGSAVVLPESTDVVGATTTDVDEVEASMAGASSKGNAAAAAAAMAASSSKSLGRRAFLIGAGAVVVGGGAYLLGTAGNDGDSDSTGSGGADAGPAGAGEKVTIAQWPLYIENDEQPKESPTIAEFIRRTGVDVDYRVEVDDNSKFTSKYQPDLEAGRGIGIDVAVLTSWMASRWIQRGWAQKFDSANIPNKANLLPRHASPPWDPNREYSLPYAEGLIVVAYFPDKTGFDLTSVADLLDPRIKGRVTVLAEMRDTLGTFMLQEGLDPSDFDVDDALRVVDKIKAARDDGQFYKISGNSYADDLRAGNTAAALAWSGDVATLQAELPDLQWVIPEAGTVSFIDTMIVPIGAPDRRGAEEWMNYLYDPEVNGKLFEYIQYVPPVSGATDFMDPELGSNPLINPPADAKIVEFRDLTDFEADDLETAFDAATQL